jgi:hypothetical protein
MTYFEELFLTHAFQAIKPSTTTIEKARQPMSWTKTLEEEFQGFHKFE